MTHPLLRGDRGAIASAGLGVQAVPYSGAGVVSNGPPIAGLVVQRAGASVVARYHCSTGIHGFLEFPAGPQVIEIRDPTGRFLDRRAVVDRASGLNVIALRPAFAQGSGPGRTAVWGWVGTPSGAPRSYARVAVAATWVRDTASGPVTERLDYVTTTDLGGGYLAPLPGVGPATPPVLNTASPPLVPQVTAQITVNALRARPDRRAPLAVFPAELDSLVPSSALFSQLYAPALPTRSEDIPIGHAKRIDFVA